MVMPSKSNVNCVGNYSNRMEPQSLSVEFAERYPALATLVGERVMSCVELQDGASVKDDTPEGVIKTPPKIYRPPLPSIYREPVLGSDLND